MLQIQSTFAKSNDFRALEPNSETGRSRSLVRKRQSVRSADSLDRQFQAKT